jgi:hypothetical protein
MARSGPKKVRVETWEDDFQSPVFKTNVHIIILDDISTFPEIFESIMGVPYPGVIEGCVYAFVQDCIDREGLHHLFIALPKDVPPKVIVHEVVHASNRIFKHAGQKLDLDNDEFQAYYTETLYEKVETCLKKKKEYDRKRRKS